MNVLHGIPGLRSLPRGTAMSIGNFDGVHLGHAHLLQTLHRLRAPAAPVALVTFEPHPLTVLKPELAPARLTPPAVKQALLAAAGVDYLVVLPPEPAVLNLSAGDFFALLRDHVAPTQLVEGANFTFGKGRSGTIGHLREWTAGTDIHLHILDGIEVPLLDLTLVPVSSSLIRFLLAQGRARDAAICLGRPYQLSGEVVKGFQRGRTLGFPTANLNVDQQLIPGDGVYAARCTVDGRGWPVALSIGPMPTFNANARQIEAHLIGFSGDLYGRALQVDLLDHLRDQRKFSGPDALKAQLHCDIAAAVALAEIDPARPVAKAG